MTELSKEEKLERRRQQLLKWKLKKESSREPDPKAPAASPIATPQDTTQTTQVHTDSPQETNGESEQERKKRLRQQKLEEWKRRKQNVATSAGARPQLSLPKKRARREHVNVFGDETEEPIQFRAPLPKKRDTAKLDGDELEAFFNSIETETGQETNDYDLDGEGPGDPEESNLEGDVEGDVEEDSTDGSSLHAKIQSLAKGKEIAAVDHSQIEYEPFVKNFYHELPAVSRLLDSDVALLGQELEITASGRCPRPVWEWAQLGLSPLVTDILAELGFTNPTAIQAQALPAIMLGRDFLGIAQTGLGKTMAFVLPLLRHVLAQRPLARGEGPVAVLLTPTRELALQTFKQLQHFSKRLGLTAACCYGGAPIDTQIGELKKGCQVVVATPGRMIDLLAANGGRVCTLRRTTYLVLDEADRMLDFGFEPQVRKICGQLRPDRQCVLFLATFARKMEQLAHDLVHDPVHVVVGGVSVVASEVTQHVELVTEPEKMARLAHILAQYPGKKLLFVETQAAADALLVQLLPQMACVAVHGGKAQVDRRHALREFADPSSGMDVLVATSVAARGLDVQGLDLVVNYDPPSHMEDYVHRVGRTGRAGKKGDAYTLVTASQERAITDLVKALRLSKAKVDPQLAAIAASFLQNVKNGTEKFRLGFGGKGLAHLDETRESQELLQRQRYSLDGPAKPKTTAQPALDLPEFNVLEGKASESTGPDTCKFHSRVTINDLPQKTRWAVVSADNLAPIIEATSTSITNKGQYYPPGVKIPETVKQGGRDVPAPPKLYLLIEGLTEAAVLDANRLIREKMVEGLAQEGSSTGRYTV